MMHTIRLLQMAFEIATTGNIKVKRDNRDELLAIKSGNYEYDELLMMADQLMEHTQKAFAHSTLPDYPNHSAAIATLNHIRSVLYASAIE